MRFQELWNLTEGEQGVSALSQYLAAGGDVNAPNPRSGWALLHAAAEHQNLPLIQALVEQGADVNARAEDGWTPLHLAVDADSDAVVQAGRDPEAVSFATTRLLLSLSADTSLRDTRGRTPRDVAQGYGAEMVIQYDRLTSACN